MFPDGEQKSVKNPIFFVITGIIYLVKYMTHWVGTIRVKGSEGGYYSYIVILVMY